MAENCDCSIASAVMRGGWHQYLLDLEADSMFGTIRNRNDMLKNGHSEQETVRQSTQPRVSMFENYVDSFVCRRHPQWNLSWKIALNSFGGIPSLRQEEGTDR